ncbi:MAG: hypothetical protein N2117_14615 [Anaerolineales bacterium]|nr:hypothetical protein [Anaerolineales bacterium]MCX7756457.1 hypothetical protein [Anaerolineales bacterium]MDW8279304.1 hypothetical protein [Anaerolineales bacterium]
MFNSILVTDFRWNRLQEPARPSTHSADLMRLLSALDTGWKILSPVRALDCQDTHGGQALEIDLYQPATGELRQLLLTRQMSVERFLNEEGVVVV